MTWCCPVSVTRMASRGSAARSRSKKSRGPSPQMRGSGGGAAGRRMLSLSWAISDKFQRRRPAISPGAAAMKSSTVAATPSETACTAPTFSAAASTWHVLAGSNCREWPAVPLWPSRAPRISTRSASASSRLAAWVPPRQASKPMARSWSSGISPRAEGVVRTGAPSCSASRATAADEPRQPWPQNNKGLSDAARRCQIRLRPWASTGAGRGWTGIASGPCAAAGPAASSTMTGPGSPDTARVRAHVSLVSMSSIRSIRITALANSCATACCGMTCWRNLASGPSGIANVTCSRAAESRRASASPDTANVKPGPGIVTSAAGRPAARK